MIFSPDTLTIFLGLATLLFLGLHTISKCRKEKPDKPVSYKDFLFRGKARSYSLASSIGATFSVSYYGATVIYGYFFKIWFVIVLVVAHAFAAALILRVLSSLEREKAQQSSCGNPLLDLLAIRLSSKGLASLLMVYGVIYFCLLVEELAVGRLVISTLFPKHPVIPAALIATICFVVLAYLRWGGFRAVLISDFEQLKLIFPFLLALVFIIYQNPPKLSNLHEAAKLDSVPDLGLVVFALVFLTGWLSTPIDFYARLNFIPSSRAKRTTQLKSFALVALLLAFFSYLIGGAFGALLPPSFSHNLTPSEFTRGGILHVIGEGSALTSVIFFASLFYMIFTTTDTLIFTLMQIGYYQDSKLLHIDRIGQIMLAAVFLSCLVPLDAVSILGVFLASLMIIPLLVIASTISAKRGSLIPRVSEHLSCPLALSFVLSALLVNLLSLDFFGYFLLPGIVLLSFFTCSLILTRLRPKEKLNEGKYDI